MKKTIFILFLLISELCGIYAQTESVKPTSDVELDRPVAVALIEGKIYYNVIVEISAYDYNNGVKIVIKDTAARKTIVRKRLLKSYLYAFSDGTLQIGKGNAITQMTLYKTEDKVWYLEYREKGLY